MQNTKFAAKRGTVSPLSSATSVKVNPALLAPKKADKKPSPAKAIKVVAKPTPAKVAAKPAVKAKAAKPAKNVLAPVTVDSLFKQLKKDQKTATVQLVALKAITDDAMGKKNAAIAAQSIEIVAANLGRIQNSLKALRKLVK